MATLKDRIIAIAKINGVDNIHNFPKCLGYFLKGIGYDFIEQTDIPTFGTVTNLKEIKFELEKSGHYILKANFTNFPVIEISGDKDNPEILIDGVKYTFKDFMKWYRKNFCGKI